MLRRPRSAAVYPASGVDASDRNDAGPPVDRRAAKRPERVLTGTGAIQKAPIGSSPEPDPLSISRTFVRGRATRSAALPESSPPSVPPPSRLEREASRVGAEPADPDTNRVREPLPFALQKVAGCVRSTRAVRGVAVWQPDQSGATKQTQSGRTASRGMTDESGRHGPQRREADALVLSAAAEGVHA